LWALCKGDRQIYEASLRDDGARGFSVELRRNAKLVTVRSYPTKMQALVIYRTALEAVGWSRRKRVQTRARARKP